MTEKTDDTVAARDTQWFADCGWGVFTHYLTTPDTSADEWNRRVNAFDVGRLADQLEEVGAGYYFMTVGQNSGHWCAPNKTYGEIMKGLPDLCSERDLMYDIGTELKKRGIRFLAYHTCDPALAYPEAVKRFQYTWGFKGDWPQAFNTERLGLRQAEFQTMWEAVTREWSEAWGDLISGWWMDGCYFADEMLRHADAPNFSTFCDALRAGNPDAIVAFNPGVLTPVITHTEHEDYTAGEIAYSFPVSPGPFVKQARFHILSFLGKFWRAGEPRFNDAFVIGYTQHVNQNGGVVTWDVPIDDEGVIVEPFVRQLKSLSENI